MREFTPPFWLRNAHLQTTLGTLLRRRRRVPLVREYLATPDGDELVLDHLQRHDGGTAPIHFILMHGLEGSSSSVYIQGLLAKIARRGYSATAMNFRSCARDPRHRFRALPNRRPRFYHSGETTDFDFVVRTLADRMPSARFAAVGASLGGNALLKWLGEHPGQTLIRAAAAISVPFDLGAGGALLEKSFMGRFYVNRFLATLREKVHAVNVRFPEVQLDVPAAMRARSFRQFDDAATAPLHGFRDADDYYERSSSIHYVSRITTPVLAISAEDDPFVPREVFARVRAAASRSVELMITPHGGHVGFLGPRLDSWAEQLAVDWILERIQTMTPEPKTAGAERTPEMVAAR